MDSWQQRQELNTWFWEGLNCGFWAKVPSEPLSPHGPASLSPKTACSTLWHLRVFAWTDGSGRHRVESNIDVLWEIILTTTEIIKLWHVPNCAFHALSHLLLKTTSWSRAIPILMFFLYRWGSWGNREVNLFKSPGHEWWGKPLNPGNLIPEPVY